MLEYDLKLLWTSEILARLHENWPMQVTLCPEDVIAATGGSVAEGHISRTALLWRELGEFLENKRIVKIGARVDDDKWDKVELTAQAAEILCMNNPGSDATFGELLRNRIVQFIEIRPRTENAVTDVVKVVEDYLNKFSKGDTALTETDLNKFRYGVRVRQDALS